MKIENRGELLGNEDSRRAGLFSTTRTGTFPANDPFHLGDRIDILKAHNDLVAMQAKDLDRQVPHNLHPTNDSTSLKSSSATIIKR